MRLKPAKTPSTSIQLDRSEVNRMPTKNLIKATLISALLVLLLAACQTAANPSQTSALANTAAAQTLAALPTKTPFPPATATPSQTPTATATPAPTQAAYGPTGFPTDVDPLTGLIVADPSILNRRPVLVKVANFPATGRPHAGLSFADIVFEYYIGEGANRFVALYYGQDATQVGPVRSGRLIDAQIVPMYQGILGFESAYSTVYSKIVNALGNRAISGSTSTCPAICDNGQHTVISVFANTADLTTLATKLGVDNSRPNLDGMAFDPQAPQGGQTGSQVAIQFNVLDRGEWRYDAASGTYLRWIESVDSKNNVTMVPLTDRLTEKQLAFDNVVVLFGNYIQYAPTLLDTDLATNTTGQKFLLFRDGQEYQGTWKSVGYNKPIQFFTQDGQPMPFKPGNTWIAIMGLSSTVKTPQTGNWEVQFYLP